MKLPAISVIIPLYNAEKYIGECLNSILSQTFQDFEVIVVDDRSTDNSVAVVQGYAPKFNGRLQIMQTQKNSGGGGYVPRNIGLKLSRGEYICFVDADDFIIETALEIFYMAATQFNADIVYTSAYYLYYSNEKFATIFDVETSLMKQENYEEKITVTIDEPNKNLYRLLLKGEYGGLFHMPWVKFVQRTLLIENKIEFPKIISGGDFIWSIQLLYHSKRFLRLPIALYFYRDDTPESVTRKKHISNKQISKCISAFLMGAKALQDLSEEVKILKQNPFYFRAAMIPFFVNCLGRTFDERMKLPPRDVYEILHSEFADDSMAAFFFSIIDEFQRDLFAAQQRIDELEKKLNAKE